MSERRSISDAPRDGTVIVGLYDNGDECLTWWSKNRVCMLGPRAGECGEGWATHHSETDHNLPMDAPPCWRPTETDYPRCTSEP